MNPAIPASTAIAPIAITSAFEPLRPPFEDPLEAVDTTIGVVAVGVATGDTGTPGENGLV
jgi:hypothetical protein